MSGVSARTIRYYTTQGLLTPPLSRGRYASYTEAHLCRLRLIDRWKRSFLPLAAIRERLTILNDQEAIALAAQPEPNARAQPEPANRSSVPLRQPPDDAHQTGVLRSLSAGAGPSVATSAQLIPMDRPTLRDPETEGWRRISIFPGVELHARVDLPGHVEQSLGQVVAEARLRLSGSMRRTSKSRHAHPSNYSLVRHIDRGWGELAFEYWWEASDGSPPNEAGELASLSQCLLYEVTTYAGNAGQYVDGWYIPPEPPFAGWKFRDPTDGRTAEVGMECFVATHGDAWDRHKVGGRLLPPVEADAFTITAVQTFRYYCDECGRDEVIPGPRGGPHEIVRTFVPSPTTGLWRYTITKHGFEAWMDVDEAGFVTDSLGLDFGPW